MQKALDTLGSAVFEYTIYRGSTHPRLQVDRLCNWPRIFVAVLPQSKRGVYIYTTCASHCQSDRENLQVDRYIMDVMLSASSRWIPVCGCDIVCRNIVATRFYPIDADMLDPAATL